MEQDTVTSLSKTTRTLHWLVALFIISLLASGIYMAETKTYSIYYWHKSFGVIAMVLVLMRVAWRIKNGWPTPVSTYSAIEQLLAKVAHYILLIGSVLMPVSGFMMSAQGGHGVSLFSIELVARNANPENMRKVIAHNQELASLAHSIHHYLGLILIVVIILHIAGALKHHLVDKDNTLKRMLGKL